MSSEPTAWLARGHDPPGRPAQGGRWRSGAERERPARGLREQRQQRRRRRRSTGTPAPAQRSCARAATLRVGATGGGAKDTIDAHLPTTDPDIMRQWNMYESLAVRTPDFARARDAARRVDRGAGKQRRSAGTVRLKHGIEFHNGKPVDRRRRDLLAAADHRPEGPEGRRSSISYIDREHLKKIDERTVRIPLKFANAALPGRPRPVLQRDRPDRLRPEEAGRHGPVQVRDLHRPASERLRRRTRTTGRPASPTSTS